MRTCNYFTRTCFSTQDAANDAAFYSLNTRKALFVVVEGSCVGDALIVRSAARTCSHLTRISFWMQDGRNCTASHFLNIREALLVVVEKSCASVGFIVRSMVLLDVVKDNFRK